jgi:hypothetical protein
MVLEKPGFKQSDAEPGLFFKVVEDNFIVLVLHVDDCNMFGKLDSIQQVFCETSK